MRLDRHLTLHTGKPQREVLRLLAAGRIAVDGGVERGNRREIDAFTTVTVDGAELPSRQAVYLMLHKPAGVLSATRDPQHPTVLGLVDHPLAGELHLAGRLDRASTGLIVLTNNGRWSKRLTGPEHGVWKTYLVETRDAVTEEMAAVFARGVYFAYEDLTTQPAELELLAPRQVRLSIREGRYHQVKRMFHAVGNRVTALHRESIGPLVLDAGLAPGGWRELTATEVAMF